MTTCAYPGGLCDRATSKRRSSDVYCYMHRARLERNGDLGPPGAVKPGNLAENARARQADPYHGDNTFPGMGKIRCVICGGRLRDHRVGSRCY